MKAYIYLSSGTVVETDVDEISCTTSNGECTGVTWTKADKGRRLLHVNPTHVSAITVQK